MAALLLLCSSLQLHSCFLVCLPGFLSVQVDEFFSVIHGLSSGFLRVETSEHVSLYPAVSLIPPCIDAPCSVQRRRMWKEREGFSKKPHTALKRYKLLGHGSENDSNSDSDL